MKENTWAFAVGLILFAFDAAFLCNLQVDATIPQLVGSSVWCLIAMGLMYYGLRPKTGQVYLILAIALTAVCTIAIIAYLIKNQIV